MIDGGKKVHAEACSVNWCYLAASVPERGTSECCSRLSGIRSRNTSLLLTPMPDGANKCLVARSSLTFSHERMQNRSARAAGRNDRATIIFHLGDLSLCHSGRFPSFWCMPCDASTVRNAALWWSKFPGPAAKISRRTRIACFWRHGRGHKYLTLVQQLDEGAKRLLYVARDRTEASLNGFFNILSEPTINGIQFACTNMLPASFCVSGVCARTARRSRR